ncbi:MAG: dethiobiotin synthase [Alphaproteobacteria bacterium]|nr:dethiobiotin synthase [Alphaproteobacteria bacterium]MCB9692033.1 dethiobiotin synthase [Alphaproteobacteria bacterium]
MARSYFVTGTDTDVGKSVITAALAAARHGQVTAVKPVASGVDGGPGDAERIAIAAGHPPTVFATWRTPVSPHLAAALEARPLDLHALLDWLDAIPEPRLIEGVGGWRVPLALEPRFEVVDLARHVDLPVLVVAANRLGVLNHTLLTVEAVRGAGLEVAAVVLNTVGAEDASTAHNLADLRALAGVPVHPFPHVDPTDPGALARAGRELDALLA